MSANTRSIDGSTDNQSSAVDAFFGEDGSLRDAEDVEAEEFSSPDPSVDVDDPDSTEEWLAIFAPNRLHTIKSKADDLPGTEQELMELHMKEVLQEARENGEELEPVGLEEVITDDGGLVMVEEQENRPPLEATDDGEEWYPLGEPCGEACPKCGNEETRSVQRQMGGADEGMTGFHKCLADDCEHTWKSGYGA